VTEDFLFTSATDSRLRIFSLESEALVAETYLETIATSLAVFEPKNDEDHIQLNTYFQVGTNFTFLVLGMVNTLVVYKFNMRFFNLTHTVSFFERREYVGGKLELPDLRITDVKFWKVDGNRGFILREEMGWDFIPPELSGSILDLKIAYSINNQIKITSLAYFMGHTDQPMKCTEKLSNPIFEIIFGQPHLLASIALTTREGDVFFSFESHS